MTRLTPPPFLSIQASRRTGCNQDVPVEKKSDPKLSRFEADALSNVCGAMLKNYRKLQPRPNTTNALQTVCEELLQEDINKVAMNFIKHLTAYVAAAANDGHSEHLQ